MRRIFSVVLVCALLTACGDDEGFTRAPIPAGQLTVVNAIPASPPLTVSTNNLGLGTLGFNEATGVSPVLPQIPLDFAAAFNNDGVIQTVARDTFEIEIDFSRLVVLTGTIAQPVVTTLVEPPFTYADGSTDTRIRFMNATTNVASATLTLTNPNGGGTTVAMTNGQPTGFTTTTAGENVEIEIRDTSSNALLWRSGTFTLTAGSDRFYILTDYFGPGSETVRMSSINDPALTAFPNEEINSAIRFSNQSTDQASLDYSIDGVLAASLAFGEQSDYIEVAAGTRNILITPTGDATTELSNVDRVVLRGSFYTLSNAVNTGIESGLGVAFFVEDRRPIDSQSVVVVTKLAPAETVIDLFFQDAGEALVGFPDLNSFPDFTSGPLSIVSGDYDLYITEAGNINNVLIGPRRISLLSGGFYSIQITDSAGGGAPLQLDLLDDFQN